MAERKIHFGRDDGLGSGVELSYSLKHESLTVSGWYDGGHGYVEGGTLSLRELLIALRIPRAHVDRALAGDLPGDRK